MNGCGFWWVDALLVVFRRAKNSRLLLRLRLILTNRQNFACRFARLYEPCSRLASLRTSRPLIALPRTAAAISERQRQAR